MALRSLLRDAAVIAVLTAGIVSCGADAPASGSGLVSIGAGLQGPSGLHARVYATGLTHVSAFAFDPHGRLWVATAAAADAGDDGVYVVPAAGETPKKVMSSHTPLGLLWVEDTLYVSSAGRVDAYSGLDGATFADHRTVITFDDGVGEVNGLALAPDGRIELGISAPCDACDPDSDLSASIVSFVTDGSDLRVDVAAVRAAVGLAYRPGTEDLFVTMNQQDGLGAATPGDWLAVVRRGQDWGFPDCYGQPGRSCAAVPEPAAVLDQHAAVTGVAFLADRADGVATTAVVAEWATGKVLSVPLTGSGPATHGTATSYLTGIENPTAIATDAQGGLYVGDWASGTIYAVG
jgi:glucose/arabinose dehydrogenase